MTLLQQLGDEYVFQLGETLVTTKLVERWQDANSDWVLVFVHPETGTKFRRREKDLKRSQTLPPLSKDPPG